MTCKKSLPEELAPRDARGIGIVMPVFNRATQVGRTLDSIARQTRRPEEVVLVDNGSTDGSLEILKHWGEARRAEGWKVRVVSESRRGAARARQTGIELLTTRYVMCFDSDDVMEADHLENVMAGFEADSELQVLAWPVTFMLPDGRRSKRRLLPGVCGGGKDPAKQFNAILENHVVQGLLSTQGLAAEREFLLSIGGWNVELGGWDDWELGLRILAAHPRIRVMPESRVILTVQENSISGLGYFHRYGDWERTMAAVEDALEESTFSESERRYLRFMLRYRRVILSAHYRHEGHPQESRKLLQEALSTEPERNQDARNVKDGRSGNPPGDTLTPFRRLLLRMAWLPTSFGLPGAGLIFPPFFRSILKANHKK